MDKTDEQYELDTTPAEELDESTWTGQEAYEEAEGEPYAEPEPENYDSVPPQVSETNPTEEYGGETIVMADQKVADEEGEGEPSIEPEPEKYTKEEAAGEAEEMTEEELYAVEQETPTVGTEYTTTEAVAAEEEGYPSEEVASGEETYNVPYEKPEY